MIDPKAIQGKITALQPSFELMAEMTGSPSTATKMGLYASYFVDQHVAMDNVNVAVEQIMTAWAKGFWPTPEQIAARAREVQRQITARERAGVSDWEQIEEMLRQQDAKRYDARLERANIWRSRNDGPFRAIVRQIDGDIRHLLTVAGLVWLRERQEYRKAFREAAVIQVCLNHVGTEARITERKLERERAERAQQFARTGHVSDAQEIAA